MNIAQSLRAPILKEHLRTAAFAAAKGRYRRYNICIYIDVCIYIYIYIYIYLFAPRLKDEVQIEEYRH